MCLLPSEDTSDLPSLDERLIPAFGALCAAEPELRDIYPAVAGVSLRAILEAKTMRALFQLADEAAVDVDDFTGKDAVVQALLASGKCLDPGPSTGYKALLESQSMPRLCMLARDSNVDVDNCTSKYGVVQALLASGESLAPAPPAGDAPPTGDRAILENWSMLDLCMRARDLGVDTSLGKKHLIGAILGSGKVIKPSQDATTDRAALMVLFDAMNGPFWTNRGGWGTSKPLGEWAGVSVDDEDRVVTLDKNLDMLSGVCLVLGDLCKVDMEQL